MTAGPNDLDHQAVKDLARKIVKLCTSSEVHPAVASAALAEVLSAILVTMTTSSAVAMDGANIIHHRVVAAIEKHARRTLNG